MIIKMLTELRRRRVGHSEFNKELENLRETKQS